MRRALGLSLLLVLVAAVRPAVAAEPRVVSVGELRAGFASATRGDRLVRDPRASWAGVTALVLRGAASMSARARYGPFTAYVFAAGHAEEAEDMLADSHTGEPLEPDAAGVRWERSTTIRGVRIWTAKTRYGANVVLLWNTDGPKRVTRAWKRLHRAFSRATS